MKTRAVVSGFLLVILLLSPRRAMGVLVEAESFDTKGGWVLDTQAVPSMGSPYLLAHGLGVPVADASTTVSFPAAGAYRVWVRTRDWVPDHPDAPGRFQLVVAGQTLATTFGTVPGDWDWQNGGLVWITNTVATVALHDLTGFDGRCDAILFDSDLETVPPDEPGALAAWRLQVTGQPVEPAVSQSFDLVVVGGGLAGCCASIAAAREGLSVALVQDRPHLGGNASQEIRVPTQGMVRHSIVESVRNYGTHRSPDMILHDSNRLAMVSAETNITLFMPWRAYAAHTNGEGRIVSVDVRHSETGERRRLLGAWFVDSTGDGSVGYWAGADFRMGREARTDHDESRAPLVGDAQTMGNSIMWNATDTGSPVSFPPVPWAMAVAGSAAAVEGGWNWEYGMLLDTIYDAEQIRDHLLRAIYGNFHNAKQLAQYANYALTWVPHVPGKRESRRLMGDHLLTENDVREGRFFEDAVGMGSWSIDVHEPASVDYRSVAIFTGVAPYYFPFRSLYSRNVPNLMMAGRCLSATHVGLGSPRVMHTCGQMGVAVGYAASICKRYGMDPRDVYRNPERTLELQLLIGGEWPERPPPLVAVVDTADSDGVNITGVWTSSDYSGGFYGTNYLHDSNADKGQKAVEFTAQLPESGDYVVYLRWTAGANRASNVPVELAHQSATGPTQVVTRVATRSRSIRNGTPGTLLDASTLPVGRIAPGDYHRGLLEFDLSSIPDDATILSASLALVVAEPDASAPGYVGSDGIQVFHLTEAVDPGHATWNDRAAGVPWSQPGGTYAAQPVSIIPAPTDPNVVSSGEVFEFPGSVEFSQAVESHLADDLLALIVRTPGIETDYNARKLYQFAAATDPRPSFQPVLTVTYSRNASGILEHFTINQRQNGSRWYPLGTYPLASNEPVRITVSNAGTDGFVIADAVGFGLADAPTLVDRDGDGLPDWWERWHFLDEVAAEGSEDPDGDGLSNTGEFICGTLPLDDRSCFRIQDMMAGVGSGWVLRWPSETNRTYRVESSLDLEGPFTILEEGIPATPPLNSFETVPSAERQFFRVVAEVPSQ